MCLLTLFFKSICFTLKPKDTFLMLYSLADLYPWIFKILNFILLLFRDLSFNNIIGRIPDSLLNMNSLSFL